MEDSVKIKTMFSKRLRKRRVAFISTYPPRECGLATYTKDLVEAISELKVTRPTIIIAVNDKGSRYNYPRSVKYQIEQESVETYKEAAEYVNASDTDLVHLQHEFGIFGGPWGDYILDFLGRLKKPLITTFHTLLMKPSMKCKNIINNILKKSNYITILSKAGSHILENVYDIIADKVQYIPHGSPNVPFIKSEVVRRRLGLRNRITLSTFGLLNRGKGIEYVIRALPPIIKSDPRILYLVIGQTHPEVRKYEGESYRKELIDLVYSLGLENNVRFENRYLRKSELIRYLQATDVCLLPYPNEDQISSGTLAYALSAGKAIISTPFLHAKEVISEGCALESKFRDPGSITGCIKKVLENESIRTKLEERAYRLSREMIWANVAMAHVNLFHKVLSR